MPRQNEKHSRPVKLLFLFVCSRIASDGNKAERGTVCSLSSKGLRRVVQSLKNSSLTLCSTVPSRYKVPTCTNVCVRVTNTLCVDLIGYMYTIYSIPGMLQYAYTRYLVYVMHLPVWVT